jgi:predicted nucleotidyltransferase
MTRDEVISALKAHEPELRLRGVSRAGVFGSLARDEAGPTSDIDVLIRFEPEAPITLWDYASLKRRVARILGVRRGAIDVIDLDAMNSRVRPSAERDAIYAF